MRNKMAALEVSLYTGKQISCFSQNCVNQIATGAEFLEV